MSRLAFGLALLASCASPSHSGVPSPLAADPPSFRAPAIPLIVQTPYLNVWLTGDRLTDDSPKLWNGPVKGMAGLLRVDGKTYRFLGLPGSALPALRQDRVRIFPTRTEIEFSHETLKLRLEFLSPLDPRDPDLLCLPLVYVCVEVESAAARNVQLYLDVTGEWAVGSSERRITWDGLFRIRPSQPRLFRETYNYPDWGELHWVAVDGPSTARYGADRPVRQAFVEGTSPPRDDRFPRAANDDWPVFAHHWDLGKVGRPVLRRAVLAHARAEAVSFLGAPCPSYWTRRFKDGTALVAWAAGAADRIRARMQEVDAEVLARARAAGGEPLAALAALTFRQAFAAGELTLRDGKPLYFLKAIDAAQSPVQSLDVMYAGAPALLAFNPALLRMQLEPILEALRRGAWHERYVMRDLGTYPNASGQSSPQDFRLEATADFVLLCAAAGRDDPDFWRETLPLLARPAQFLLESALGVESQVSADDFQGPQTGNANLSLKAILALAAIPGHRGDADALFKRWRTAADAGDHTALALGDTSGWGLQYNLAADRLFGLGLVPDSLVAREVAFYRARANRYGTPLDGRSSTGRADWLLWVAAVAPRAEREAIAADVLRLYSETPSRLPSAERYETDTAKQTGNPARSTLGAVFAPVLLHERARAPNKP